MRAACDNADLQLFGQKFGIEHDGFVFVIAFAVNMFGIEAIKRATGAIASIHFLKQLRDEFRVPVAREIAALCAGVRYSKI